jgi:hypothetical protein
MSLFPGRPADGAADRPDAVLEDRTIEERREHRAEAGAARWRAGALAEAIFGGRVVPRLRSARTAAGFRAMVELEVPFRDLDAHREAEARFLSAAYCDEILGGIPVVFVFTPVVEGSGVAGAPWVPATS